MQMKKKDEISYTKLNLSYMYSECDHLKREQQQKLKYVVTC